MDHLAPPMFDVSYVDMWKFRMSAYLKALGLHVYLTTTKNNNKYFVANAQPLEALGAHLTKIIFLLFLIVILLL